MNERFRIHQTRYLYTRPLLAQLVLESLAHETELDRWYEWPQKATTFLFGAEARPLPLGALQILWKQYPALSFCPACRITNCYGLDFGGLLSIGGLHSVCTSCSGVFLCFIGGLGAMWNFLKERLDGSPFFVNVATFGGAHSGDGYLLLKELNIRNEMGELPSLNELYDEKEAVQVSVKTEKGKEEKLGLLMG